MKESRRWTFHKDMPDEATDFSSFQLQGVLQRGRLTQKLDQLRKDMTMRTSGEVAGIAGKGSVQSSRIVSEDTGHYVLVKGPKSDHAQGSLIDNSTEGGFFREEEDDKIATNIYPKYLEKASKPSTVPVPTFEVPHIESSDSEATSPFVEVPEASFRFQSDGTTCHQAKEMTEQYIPSDQPSCENDDLTVNGEIAKRRNRIEAPLKSTDLRVNVENVSTKKGESQDNKPVSMEKESDLDSIKQSKDRETNITVTTVTAFFNDKQKPKSSAEAEDLSVNIADGMVQKDGAINIELNESSCRNDETSKDVASNVLFENNENSSKLSNGGSYEAEVFSLHLESSTASSESSDGEPVPQQRTGARFDREVNEFITPEFIDQKSAANSDIVASAGNSIVDEAESAFDKPPVAFAVRNQEDVASSNAAPTEILTEDLTKTAEICMIESDSEPETHGSAVAAEISIDANKPASRRPSISRPMPEQSEFAGVSKRDLEEVQTNLNREQRTLQSERARQARASAEVSTEMLNESQELLRLFGVPFLVSPMEAEAQCAFLDMTGQTDGTITDDSDVFLFGGRRVYKNIFNQNKHAECYTCEDIDKGLALSRSKMIKLAFVTGSDYTEGIQGLGAVSAMEVLHEFSQDGFAALKELRKWYDEALDNGVTKHETKIKTKLRTVALPTGFPSREVYDAYTDPVVDESRDRFEWARPDLHEIRMFASDKLGWTSKRTDELMLPVMKELNKNESQTTMEKFFQVKFQETRKKHSKRVRRVINRMRYDSSSSGLSSEDEAGRARPGTSSGKAVQSTSGKQQKHTEQRPLDKARDKGPSGSKQRKHQRVTCTTVELQDISKRDTNTDDVRPRKRAKTSESIRGRREPCGTRSPEEYVTVSGISPKSVSDPCLFHMDSEEDEDIVSVLERSTSNLGHGNSFTGKISKNYSSRPQNRDDNIKTSALTNSQTTEQNQSETKDSTTSDSESEEEEKVLPVASSVKVRGRETGRGSGRGRARGRRGRGSRGR
ncbi:DNA excision repair protein ERCC-5 homolog isoform X2 [Nematostella vectensis]|nr:DNA excision repair protein ERCC-5 homolog isoform X2 [Nematostella vectensis]XP_032243238.2 DNA excision repair protein ERCC-5 homolog isoform X2 [Nematostella vectensis]